jgi:hypothetical protein
MQGIWASADLKLRRSCAAQRQSILSQPLGANLRGDSWFGTTLASTCEVVTAPRTCGRTNKQNLSDPASNFEHFGDRSAATAFAANWRSQTGVSRSPFVVGPYGESTRMNLVEKAVVRETAMPVALIIGNHLYARDAA